jgi:hypothetical protein
MKKRIKNEMTIFELFVLLGDVACKQNVDIELKVTPRMEVKNAKKKT